MDSIGDSIGGRIAQFREKMEMSQTQFGGKLGVSASSISLLEGDRHEPGFKFISALYETFPNLNLIWLLFGEGQMLNTKEEMLEIERQASQSGVEGTVPMAKHLELYEKYVRLLENKA